ncbi:MAG: peptidylprolyl isomerase, partial [Bacteroidia bacterium]|nr:peptidylprolyl isomerase [Bacteroidia bacterium]
PPLDSESANRAKKKLEEIRTLILADSLSFEQAAVKYSEDTRTKNNNGSITTDKNDTRVPLDQLDADLYLKIDRLKINEISEPMEFISTDGNQAYKGYHIVKLKNKLPPHQANLKDDYQKFYQAALEAKQMVELEKWFQTAKQQVYIDIRPGECASALTNWK